MADSPRPEETMSNWNRGGRHHGGFPAHIRRQATRDLPAECAHCGSGGRLWLDHITPAAEGGTHDITNAQWLCTTCHDRKTRHEAARGQQRRAQRGRMPTEAHPGLR